MSISAQVIDACIHARVPCCSENPESTKHFAAPPIRWLCQDPSFADYISVCCQKVPCGEKPLFVQAFAVAI